MKVNCPKCLHSVVPIVSVLEKGVHYAEKRCPICNAHLGYLPKPKNLNKRPKNKYTAASLEIEACQLCLRHRDMLGRRGVLEIHHVNEIQVGGEDTVENIWVLCTSCHSLVHHQRTYLFDHFKKQDMIR